MSNSTDKATLLTRLQTLVETNIGNGSTIASDILAAALSIDLFNESRINTITVANINALPNLKLYTSPSGMLYYVNDIDVFAISSGFKWLTLDGKLLRTDSLYGDIFSWGNNSSGQLGYSTITNRSAPTQVIGNFIDWCEVGAGCSHNFGIRTNGTAWAWGYNQNGHLGIGCEGPGTCTSSPVSVIGGFTNWIQIDGGGRHGAGLRSNGQIRTWGWNPFGQLGSGTTSGRNSPGVLSGGGYDWCQVSTGQNHTLAVKTNGTGWSWGYNYYGQLGHNTAHTCSRSSPVQIVGGFTWCRLIGGGQHTLGIKSDGTAWVWGNNRWGQIGNGECDAFPGRSRSSPVSVVGGFTDWCQLSGGFRHSLGLRSNGTAWAWGCNTEGQLGDGTVTCRSSPVSVVGGFTDWCQIAAGSQHGVGLRTNGTLWAWGLNNIGQLGNKTLTNTSSPITVSTGITGWTQVRAKSSHTLALRFVC